MAALSDRRFLGIEISTQQLKVLAVDDSLTTIYEDSLKFDTDLPEFRTQGGAHIHPDGVTVTAPPLMWVKALDMILAKMKSDGFDFSKVAAISGTGQQHGSVYWKDGAEKTLKNLQPDKTLADQLKDSFSVTDSPIWMDSSTSKQCRELEKKLGGPQHLADITGARAYERLTGNQIAKIHQTYPDLYNQTERISLVSSFGCCLLLDHYAPIDYTDGSGMNLLDIRTKTWSPECLQATAPDLAKKLGDPAPAFQCVGSISNYMVDRHGFSPECQVVAFTGDNPDITLTNPDHKMMGNLKGCQMEVADGSDSPLPTLRWDSGMSFVFLASLAGMRMRCGEVAMSLGTSDVVILRMEDAKPSLEGDTFVDPLEANMYMAILCFKNGSLTRERIRDQCADGSWDKFAEILAATPPGNNGLIGMYFDLPEIIPRVVGDHRFNQLGDEVSSFSPKEEVRAVIEGQFLSKRIHAENIGYQIGPETRVLATGGASFNKAILQVLSDVFNSAVYVQNIANSAVLGCAYRAKHGLLGGDTSFHEVVANLPDFHCSCQPNPEAAKIYENMAVKYRSLEAKIPRSDDA